MKALVVYESLFGNTRHIAEAVARGLGSRCQVDIAEIEQASYSAAGDADLLVVGGPTHMWGMSRQMTRMIAHCSTSQETISRDRGVREWLAALPASDGALAAAFDTHLAVNGREPVGSAAHGIASRLTALGYRLALPPQAFLVRDTYGPVLKGEVQHATHWGKQLAWHSGSGGEIPVARFGGQAAA